ncbi:MAG TPA: DNA topoisomerase IV subunit A [Candidatus Ornithospirochaeta avicola]|uniref:DNA topoisomerase IV subunit A n=1 Tax=Candidatus Ornithospirochaeta avicola TaxID=2840896 RepID=A0A9D1PSI3_9SPIO|nr:DNA topoisomerase IV subunit A [Candidatus Ornithospirochaeta avicola]
MAHAEELYKKNFLEYASYVIRERAIPEITDGLKPVQRRILHTLLEKDEGKFMKVAGVVGATMAYHPHGDASITEALVNLVNANLFVEGQGNYGNFLTGDGAAAGRYIECRLFPLARKVLYSPEITEYVDSYDGRAKEPVVFPAKIPVVLIQGTQGIAVGMATTILPHNIIEVLEAQKKAIRGEEFELFPDFPGGGIMDVSEYNDGTGRVTIRAKMNAEDPKELVIEELPYGITSERLIESIQSANKNGQLKIDRIEDLTAEKAQIVIHWQRNTYSKDMVDVLYATTDCQIRISVNPLVIKDNLPHIVPISEQVRFHARHIQEVLKAELEVELGKQEAKLRARTLERIFVEERIYKEIENKKTAEDVNGAIIKGFENFLDEVGGGELDSDDIERLLKIPIRRISLFDIEKNRKEIEEINAEIADIKNKLSHLKRYAVSYIDELIKMIGKDERVRKTEISSFESLSARQVAVRNMDIRYDKETGYIGTNIKTGESLLKVSPFDRIFYMKNNGEYRVTVVSDKEYIGTDGIFYINYAEKDIISKEIFTIIYTEKSRLDQKRICYIKRFMIPSFTTGKLYSTIKSDGAKVKKISLYPSAVIFLQYKSGKGYKQLEETMRFADFRVQKSSGGQGVRLTAKEIEKIAIRQTKDMRPSGDGTPDLFESSDD